MFTQDLKMKNLLTHPNQLKTPQTSLTMLFLHLVRERYRACSVMKFCSEEESVVGSEWAGFWVLAIPCSQR